MTDFRPSPAINRCRRNRNNQDRYRSPAHYGGALLSFEEIFEQDARWFMGKKLIHDVVNHIKGKPLLPVADPKTGSLYMEPPLPTIRDVVSGTDKSIIWMVPPELFQIFLTRLNMAMTAYLGDEGASMLEKYLRVPINAVTIHSIQADLWNIERIREAYGEGELWKFVADYLGMPSLSNPLVMQIRY